MILSQLLQKIFVAMSPFWVGHISFVQFNNIYVSIVRLIHLELGLKNPLKENWFVSSVLSGIKRGKGASQSYKLPVDISMLRQFHQKIKSHRCGRFQVLVSYFMLLFWFTSH